MNNFKVGDKVLILDNFFINNFSDDLPPGTIVIVREGLVIGKAGWFINKTDPVSEEANKHIKLIPNCKTILPLP